MITKNISLTILLSINLIGLSDTINNHFLQYTQDAKNYHDINQHSVNSFPPEKNLSNYTINPPEANYYQNNGIHDNLLNKTANTDNEKIKDSIQSSYLSRPQYHSDDNEPAIARGKFIQNNAQNITHGRSTSDINCKEPKEQCITHTATEYCTIPNQYDNQICIENNVIDVENPPIPPLMLTAGYTGTNLTLDIDVNLKTGAVNFAKKKSIKTVNVHIEPDNPFNYAQCGNYTLGNVVKKDFNDPKLSGKLSNNREILEINTTVDCRNWLLHLHFKPRGQKTNIVAKYAFSLVIDVAMNNPQIRSEAWRGCERFLSINNFSRVATHCLEGTEKRIIDGLAITRDCWKRQATYHYQSSVNVKDTCEAVKKRQCSLISSRCGYNYCVDNLCFCDYYDQRYECSSVQCQIPNGIPCAETIFCLDGDCVINNQIPNPNFDQAAAQLAAANQSGQAVDDARSLTPVIFSGQAKSCRKDSVGFSNCCADNGWGQQINLAHCNEEEKMLYKAREKKLAVKVGSYCSKKNIVGCVQRSDRYCVFDGILQRIIQVDGRYKQLHISFGSGKNPNCRGITADELTKMNFNTMNFSDYYQNINAGTHIPEKEKIYKNIESSIKKYEN